MNQETENVLLFYGWIVECESPLEIRSEDGSGFASGAAAEILIEYYTK